MKLLGLSGGLDCINITWPPTSKLDQLSVRPADSVLVQQQKFKQRQTQRRATLRFMLKTPGCDWCKQVTNAGLSTCLSPAAICLYGLSLLIPSICWTRRPQIVLDCFPHQFALAEHTPGWPRYCTPDMSLHANPHALASFPLRLLAAHQEILLYICTHFASTLAVLQASTVSSLCSAGGRTPTGQAPDQALRLWVRIWFALLS